MEGVGNSLFGENGEPLSQQTTAASGEDSNPAEEGSARPSRSRKMTEKGRLYAMDTMSKQIDSLFDKLMMHCDSIQKLMADNTTVTEIRQQYSVWLNTYEHYLGQAEVYKQLTEGEQSFLETSQTREIYLRNFKTSVENYFLSCKPETEDPCVNVSGSETQRKTKSSKSSRSVVSVGSLMSSVSASKIKEEQYRAELNAKMASYKQKEDLEMAKLKLKLQEEQLELSTELAMSNAKTKVLEKYENVDINIDNDDVINETKVKKSHYACNDYVSRSVLNPYVPPFNPDTSLQVPVVSNQQALNTYTTGDNPTPNYNVQNDNVLSIVQYLSKPPPEIKKFDGNPREYRKFIRQFRAKVEANTSNADERLNYLEQFTVGEANKVVSGFSHLSGEKGFPAAMKELEERYGNSDIIASSFIKRALDWPQLKNGDSKALDEFSIFLVECQNAVEGIEALKTLEYPDNMRKLIAKLPVYMHDRWRSVVQNTKRDNSIVQFKHLVSFVRGEAKKATDPLYGRDALTFEQKDSHPKSVKAPVRSKQRHSFAATASSPCQVKGVAENKSATSDVKTSSGSSKQFCIYCNISSHCLDACKSFAMLSIQDKYANLKENGACFGCLKRGHMKGDCKNKSVCTICQRRHPSVLHDKRKMEKTEISPLSESQDNVVPNCLSNAARSLGDTGAGDVSCSMAIIPVKVKFKNRGDSVQTYAFFDTGSSVSFCTESLLRKLGGHGKKMNITLTTMGEPYSMQTYAVNGLQICDLDLVNSVNLPRVYTKKIMPVSNCHIPKQDDIKQWPHMDNIKLPEINADIGIMIGNNVPDALAPLEICTGPRGSPHATRTLLGWIIWSLVHPSKNITKSVTCSELLVNRAEIAAIQKVESTKRLERMIEETMKFDFPEKQIDDKREPSREDKQFLEQVENSINLQNGHYYIDLPFRDPDVCLPNNIPAAMKRLNCLKAKLQKNPDFMQDYIDFMEKIIDQGHAERVPETSLNRNDGRVWFLPHHGVYHPRKPGKIRVVFDCSATYMGVSLNNQLLSGPDLTNRMLGVLLRFREEKIGVIGDIDAMFYQVRVPRKDSDCLRFLWWPKGDLQSDPVQYRMLVHIFGAISSPSCSNYALQKTADDNEADFDPDVVQLVKRNMYVDDCVSSASSEQEASYRIKQVRELCSRGGFQLTKWVSNSHAVLGTIPQQERAKGIRELDLKSSELPNERALGVYWFTEKDSLGFKIDLKERPSTRRGILSTVSSVFDPLGLVAPFILTAKALLQELCKLKVNWDQEVTGNLLKVWKQWLDQVSVIEKLTVSRCYKPSEFGHLEYTQLHVFSDASEIGYGVVVYLRLTDITGRIHCTMAMSKSRVAPLKQISIPRMELTAAMVAVRLGSYIRKELSYPINETFFWTDSMSTLRYIKNKTCRFHTFVANRLSIIHEATEDHQWRFVETKKNPADIASRGCSANKLVDDQIWKHGPEFLYEAENKWPFTSTDDVRIPKDDCEVKEVSVAANVKSTQATDRLVSYFSSWHKLKRITALILLGFNNLKRRIADKKAARENIERSESDPDKRRRQVKEFISNYNQEMLKSSQQIKPIILKLCDQQKAERSLIQYAQRSFHEELKILQDSNSNKEPAKLKKSSRLYRLDPFVKDNLLRVGGRIDKSDLPYDARHPIILPKDSPISQLILEDKHRTLGHLGKLSILSDLRQKYWIIGANSEIKRMISKCLICRRYQGSVGKQKMASLPKERLSTDDAPFTHVGMDFFGPFQIKRGRTVVKRYGVIFTCMTMRAVHLEIADSMDTQSCINAIRRFIARRGPIQTLRTDNGSNLVGAERELREEIHKWNIKQINDALLQKNINWDFNPPSASNFGGVWERLIRSTRKILFSLMREQQLKLDDEALRTLFCEVEAILNNRPLTELPDNPDDLRVLTPNHLLLLRQGESFPPGIFDRSDNYVTRRWRQVQYLANMFWSRWSKEYLPLLQERQKWVDPQRNLAVGDIVLVVENTPRNSWVLARTIEVFPDKRGYVRSAKVKTASNVLHRPINKLCLLLECDSGSA